MARGAWRVSACQVLLIVVVEFYHGYMAPHVIRRINKWHKGRAKGERGEGEAGAEERMKMIFT